MFIRLFIETFMIIIVMVGIGQLIDGVAQRFRHH